MELAQTWYWQINCSTSRSLEIPVCYDLGGGGEPEVHTPPPPPPPPPHPCSPLINGFINPFPVCRDDKRGSLKKSVTFYKYC